MVNRLKIKLYLTSKMTTEPLRMFFQHEKRLVQSTLHFASELNGVELVEFHDQSSPLKARSTTYSLAVVLARLCARIQ
jgi:hypothetical protein